MDPFVRGRRRSFAVRPPVWLEIYGFVLMSPTTILRRCAERSKRMICRRGSVFIDVVLTMHSRPATTPSPVGTPRLKRRDVFYRTDARSDSV